MKEFLRIVWAVLLYLWQLPQNLIGLVYLAFCFDRVKITKQGGAVFYATKHVRGGMTMGRYFYLSQEHSPRTRIRSRVRPCQTIETVGMAVAARIRHSERPALPFLSRG